MNNNLVNKFLDLNENDLNYCFNNIEINNNFNKIIEILNKVMIESLLKIKLGRKLSKTKKQVVKIAGSNKKNKKKNENKLNLQIYRDKLLKLRKIDRKKK